MIYFLIMIMNMIVLITLTVLFVRWISFRPAPAAGALQSDQDVWLQDEEDAELKGFHAQGRSGDAVDERRVRRVKPHDCAAAQVDVGEQPRHAQQEFQSISR